MTDEHTCVCVRERERERKQFGCSFMLQHEERFLLFTEAVTPLVLATQNQFNFTHILAGATAVGKVCLMCVLT